VQGTIVRAGRNSFLVECVGGGTFECNIKGKVLKNSGDFYNPLAWGDVVTFEDGGITGLEPRRNYFSRWNEMGRSEQLLACNIDGILVLASGHSPPWRPRFLDRVLLQADANGIPVLIAANKTDLGYSAEAQARLALFGKLGCGVFPVSARTGEGLGELRAALAGKTLCLAGQSGAGKSSLVNALVPGAGRTTGSINLKWDRGNHTTVSAALVHGAGFDLVDTPGLRHFIPALRAEDAATFMKDIASFAPDCAYYPSCTHTKEKGCAVLAALERGDIESDRYDSYLTVRTDLEKRFPSWYN
jgi:ribosome biogenesis GTPase